VGGPEVESLARGRELVGDRESEIFHPADVCRQIVICKTSSTFRPPVTGAPVGRRLDLEQVSARQRRAARWPAARRQNS
jgi:hypothetical protein